MKIIKKEVFTRREFYASYLFLIIISSLASIDPESLFPTIILFSNNIFVLILLIGLNMFSKKKITQSKLISCFVLILLIEIYLFNITYFQILLSLIYSMIILIVSYIWFNNIQGREQRLSNFKYKIWDEFGNMKHY